MPETVELDAKNQELVAALVKSGRYTSADDVINDGLRLVHWREQKQAEFDAEIEKGLDDIRSGRVRDADEIFDELIAKYDAMANQAAE